MLPGKQTGGLVSNNLSGGNDPCAHAHTGIVAKTRPTRMLAQTSAEYAIRLAFPYVS